MADSKGAITRGDKKAVKSRLDSIMAQIPYSEKKKPNAKKVGDK